jgi:hypothetical protein
MIREVRYRVTLKSETGNVWVEKDLSMDEILHNIPRLTDHYPHVEIHRQKWYDEPPTEITIDVWNRPVVVRFHDKKS